MFLLFVFFSLPYTVSDQRFMLAVWAGVPAAMRKDDGGCCVGAGGRVMAQ